MDIENVKQTLIDETTISKYEQESVNENGWSNRTLHLLRSSLNQCKRRYNKHSEYAHKCSILHQIISIPGFISGSIASGLALYIVGSPDSATLKVSISVAILSSISSIIKGIETTVRYNEKEYIHKKAVDVYGELCRRIELYILQPDIPAKSVLSEIKKDYDNAVSHNPYVFID